MPDPSSRYPVERVLSSPTNVLVQCHTDIMDIFRAWSPKLVGTSIGCGDFEGTITSLEPHGCVVSDKRGHQMTFVLTEARTRQLLDSVLRGHDVHPPPAYPLEQVLTSPRSTLLRCHCDIMDIFHAWSPKLVGMSVGNDKGGGGTIVSVEPQGCVIQDGKGAEKTVTLSETRMRQLLGKAKPSSVA